MVIDTADQHRLPCDRPAVALLTAGRSLSKDEIMQAAWPSTVVEEGNLTMQISTLRRILDDGSATGSLYQDRVRKGLSVCPSGKPFRRAADGRSGHTCP
jgi:DNA-binding response OmpR family regulator